jgi:tetratricopeptide (TPR) repeat protein
MIPSTGDIKDMTLPWLFQDIRTEKVSGTATFSRDDEVKTVYFKGGDILFASSNVDEERLGEFLLRRGKITKAQFDQSSTAVIKTGKKLSAVLFEAGILKPHDLVALVNLQVKEIILKLFSWRDGRYKFEQNTLSPAELIPLHISTGDLIIEGVSNLDWKVIRKSLPPLSTVVRPASDPSLLFQNAHFDQDQRDVLSLIDGNKSIQDLCSLSGIGDFNTLKAMYVLMALRMVEVGEIKTEDDKKFVSEVVRDEVTHKGKHSEEPTLSSADMKKLIQSAYEGLSGKNHYEALGVARSATPQEIKKAYFQHAKLYHPDRHFDPEMSDMKEKLEALFASIHEAYETLSTQSRRDIYDSDLAREETRIGAAEAAQRGRRNNKEMAADQFQEGKVRFKVQDFWGAEESFRWAMRLDPKNAEYVFHMGLALSRIPRRGHEAEEYFVKAAELSPSNTKYFLELGNFYLKNGLRQKALSMFQKALKNDPASDKIKSLIKSAGGKP